MQDWTLGCENLLTQLLGENFELAGEQDLTHLGRLQVSGATCLVGGHLPRPNKTLGYI